MCKNNRTVTSAEANRFMRASNGSGDIAELLTRFLNGEFKDPPFKARHMWAIQEGGTSIPILSWVTSQEIMEMDRLNGWRFAEFDALPKSAFK